MIYKELIIAKLYLIVFLNIGIVFCTDSTYLVSLKDCKLNNKYIYWDGLNM